MIYRKNTWEIGEDYSTGGAEYYIAVKNIISQKNWHTKINYIINALVEERELFFGFYRYDGLTLTKDEWIKYGKEIPLFFENNGEYKELVETVTNKRGLEKRYSGYLTVARTQISGEFYDYLKWILQFYLETVFFAPRIPFEKFEEEFKNYMHSPGIDYIAKGYTDFLFSYYDSGDFSVFFSPEKHDIDDVRNIINTAMGANE